MYNNIIRVLNLRPKRNKRLSFQLLDFLFGGLAGAGATVFTNPMDVVKTRLQLQGELKAQGDQAKRYRGISHAMYVIWKTDGVLALQKGLVPAMVFGFVMNSVRLGLYRAAETKGWTKSKNDDIALPKAVFWSSLSGLLGGVAANPASVLKTRIQAAAHPSIAVGTQHQYNGMIHGFLTLYKKEGVRGYFAGVTATGIRLSVGSAAQLTTFSAVKEWLQSRGVCAGSPFGLAFVASAVSGIAITVVICPFDVVTIRLYNQGSNKIGCGLLYTGFLDCLTKIYKTEGIHGMYKGMGALYFRMAPHTTLSLVIWDMLNHTFENK